MAIPRKARLQKSGEAHADAYEAATPVEPELPTDAETTEEQQADFEEILKEAFTQCYPELLGRVSTSQFADWHRKCRTHVDLAHRAMLSVMQHARKKRMLPDNLLAYTVTTAENLAKRDWAHRLSDPLAKTASDPSMVKTEGKTLPEHDEQGMTNMGARDLSPLTPLGELSTYMRDEPEKGPNPLVDEIRLLIEELPKRQRQVLKLYLANGSSKTYREMAEEIGISEDNFQHALDRAGQSICNLLKARGFDGVPQKIAWRDVGSKTPLSMKGDEQ